MICRANQLTGFYMMGILVIKELIELTNTIPLKIIIKPLFLWWLQGIYKSINSLNCLGKVNLKPKKILHELKEKLSFKTLVPSTIQFFPHNFSRIQVILTAFHVSLSENFKTNKSIYLPGTWLLHGKRWTKTKATASLAASFWKHWNKPRNKAGPLTSA